MKPTQTGIAVAVALVVVGVFFIFPGLSPFGSLNPADQPQSAMSASDLATSTNPNPTMATEPTELQVTDTVVGSGEAAAAGDTVTVNYTGMFTDGTVFDASSKHGTTGFTFPLGAGQVIKGWDQGIVGMKVGGKRHLIVPSSLAYGEQGAGGGIIPPNTTLVFDVELLSVKKAQ